MQIADPSSLPPLLQRALLDLASGAGATADDRVIDEVLALLGTTLRCGRVGRFEYDHDAQVATCTHEWVADGVRPLHDARQGMDVSMYAEGAELHAEGQQLVVTDTRDPLVAEPMQAWWAREQVTAVLTSPLHGRDGAGLVGFLGCDEVAGPRTWSDTERELARSAAALLDDPVAFLGSHRGREHVQWLVASSEQLEAFAHTVAHDLRAPLANVHAQLLLADDDRVAADERQALLRRARVAVEDMAALIDRILGYAAAGREVGQPEPVELDRVVADARRHLESRFAVTGARLLTDPLPVVVGDRHRLTEVVVNLLSNALLHAGRDRVPLIRVRGSMRGPTAVLVVEDDGPGVAPAEREGALRTFERGSAPPGTGSGLGLPICARIAAAHGGTLHLGDSALGGLAVTVTLPAEDAGPHRW